MAATRGVTHPRAGVSWEAPTRLERACRAQHLPDPQGRGHRRLRRDDDAVREAEASARQRLRVLPPQPVLKAVLAFEGKVDKWDELDPTLKSYAQLASAGVIGCWWCLDFGYFMAHNDGLDLAKVREVPRWRESDVFTPLERDVLEYAEAMSVTPPTVTDEMVAACSTRSATPAVVELTQMVALENMRSRFNSAPGCRARATPTSASCPSPYPRHEPASDTPSSAPQPALHRRLRDARLRGRRRGRRSRRRGCAGSTSTWTRCASRAPTSSGSPPGPR